MSGFLAMPFLLSKIGSVNPATRSKAIEIVSATQAAGHRVRFVWGKGSGSEHATGNALDIMVYDADAGDFIRNYVWVNRARLRLRHVIWAQHITSTVAYPGVRRLMADRGNTTENHYDHNHILFLDAQSYVAPSSPKPKPQPKPVVVTKVTPIDLTVDGTFGPMTVEALQRWVGVRDDGVLGKQTVMALQRKVGTTPDGDLGPNTINHLQSMIGRTPVGHWDRATTTALQRYLNAR